MSLVGFWFYVIAILWTGFFVLEGFDFGVGMLHGIVGRDGPGRAAAIATIGPLWDGNEVWLIVAGAAMFAAFPGWYATMFSGFYLALVLLLAALIVRGVSFEYRGKMLNPRRGRIWDWLMSIGSLVAPLLIGVALGNLLSGVPIDSQQEYTGNFWDLLRPYPIFVGVTVVVLCVMHGATFLTLKTTGDLNMRARRIATRVAPVAAVLVLVFAFWTHSVAGRGVIPSITEIAAVLAVIAAAWLVLDRREGWAFALTTFVMATTIMSIFIDLNPRVMVSSTRSAYDLTISNTSSGSYALKVMTVVLAVLFPVVIVYQSWTYYVFRQRVSRDQFVGGSGEHEHGGPPMAPAPAAASSRHRSEPPGGR
ncbi:MAG TPA: cytochrome d ubiquinol oxidase subunit II [Micromonosporaceae bacterium]|nr:cytochrome d ubiquinol oxidase subunit II [Micromonosporaceae bacterium]